MTIADPILFIAATRNYFCVPRWIAMDEGLFTRHGIDFRTEEVTSTDAAALRVKAGTAQLSTSAMEQVIIDRDDGGSLVAVAGNVNRLPFSLIAQPSIRTIGDLRGKVIGVSSLKTGTSAILTQVLAAHGLGPTDYRFVAVGPIDARWTMLQSGEIDAGLQGIPQSFAAVDAGFSDLGSAGDLFPHLQFASFTVEENWACAHREPLVRVLRAMLEAFRLFYADRDLATRVAMRHGGFSRDHAVRAWKAYVADEVFPRDGDVDSAGLSTLIALSATARGVPERASIPPDRYVDRSYLTAARQMASGSMGR